MDGNQAGQQPNTPERWIETADRSRFGIMEEIRQCDEAAWLYRQVAQALPEPYLTNAMLDCEGFVYSARIDCPVGMTWDPEAKVGEKVLHQLSDLLDIAFAEKKLRAIRLIQRWQFAIEVSRDLGMRAIAARSDQ